MRLQLRNQIIELLGTLWEGIEYTKSTSEQTSTTIFENCLKAVTSIDNSLIKQLSSEKYNYYSGVKSKLKDLVVSILELKKNGFPYSEQTQEIENIIKKFRKSLLNEDEVKLEILFLPYKASMWDSLESIWKAASEDPHCDCYVVPIPYYIADKNGPFSIAEYEGDNFPNDVPITHYSNYDIEKRHPDVIYIHNPYDDSNTLTRIYPQYFSEELNKNTDILVYSPYFVALRFDADLEDRHFYLQPAAINADFYIAQSRQLKEHLIRLGYSSKKILSFGSPKVDATLKHSKNEDIVPIDWKEKIGSKTVVLYNTPIFAMGKGNPYNAIYAILHNIFMISHLPNCFVIWRPHPLMLSGIKRYYNNETAELFISVIEKIRRFDNVIIDDLPSYFPSFNVSDCLVSHRSSLVFDYLVTGKPVFISDYLDSTDVSKGFIFSKNVIYGNIFDSKNQNFMYKDFIDTNDNATELFEQFNEEFRFIYDLTDNQYRELFLKIYKNKEIFDVLDFVNLVSSKKDPLYKLRMEELAKKIPNLNGNAGNKIHEYIYHKLI